MIPLTNKKIILVDQIAVKHHNRYIGNADFTLTKGLCYHPTMPSLLQLLRVHHSATLKVIADYWGILELEITAEMVAREIEKNLNSGQAIKEMIEVLPSEARSAWNDLNTKGGIESWAVFTRQFGDIRPMGASRIERERPYLHPVSAAEILWYRGLLGRIFADQEPEPQEIAFVPDES